MYHPASITHQLVLRYVVKELLQVYVNYPFTSLVEVFSEFQYCLFTTSAWAEAVAVLLKLFLKSGCEDLTYRLLQNSVNNARYPKFPYPSLRLGYLYPPHRLRAVLPRKDGLLDTFPIRIHVVTHLFDGHAVYARCTSIGDYLVQGFSHVALGKYLFD